MNHGNFIVVRYDTGFVKSIAEANSPHPEKIKFGRSQSPDAGAPTNHASLIEGMQNLFVPHGRNVPEDPVDEPNNFITRFGSEINRPELGWTKARNPVI
jgi:hypothetical protein